MTWIVVAGALYMVWVLALFLGQRTLLFPGKALPIPGVAAPGPGVEIWTLDTSVGAVEAWYHPPAKTDPEASQGSAGDIPDGPMSVEAPAILFAHGNGERIDDWAGAFQPLADRGVAVLLVEYPGYGRSEGTPSQASITEAMVAGWDRLAARPEVDSTRIVGLGRSLGGGAVAALARRRTLRALVFQAAFTSVRAFAGRYLVPPFLVRDPFDVLEVVREFEGPILVVHGTADRVVPFHHGRTLASASPRATLRSYPCAHNDCPPDWNAWLGELVEFLEEAGIYRPGR